MLAPIGVPIGVDQLEVGELNPLNYHLLSFSCCMLFIVLHERYVSCTMGKLVDL
jgi:hypothetical protein